MNYSETIKYLFEAAPLFQQIGGAAYKEGLENTLLLDEHFDHPHRNYRTIHVGGTNGKGSCAHTLAAALQHKGLKVGLYTSPHLVDFRERIRINGNMIPEEYVVSFVEQERDFFEPLHPSFFEITTAMALKYFADEKVDVAVIEVGLGGRLDCTNIITPVLSLITNISLDHTQFLGTTHAAIAAEKAGIIKPHVPVVVGESLDETRPVFEQKAREAETSIRFADDGKEIVKWEDHAGGLRTYHTLHWGTFEAELTGACQIKNTATLLSAFDILSTVFELTQEDVHYAFRHVCEATGLQGRWQTLHEAPKVICDTGHNTGGWEYLSSQLQEATRKYQHVHIVFGMAADKDVEAVIDRLPQMATYYWTKASVRRAMDEHQISQLANRHQLQGKVYEHVSEAYEAAMRAASPADFIYVGGSCFVVADLLAYLKG